MPGESEHLHHIGLRIVTVRDDHQVRGRLLLLCVEHVRVITERHVGLALPQRLDFGAGRGELLDVDRQAGPLEQPLLDADVSGASATPGVATTFNVAVTDDGAPADEDRPGTRQPATSTRAEARTAAMPAKRGPGRRSPPAR